MQTSVEPIIMRTIAPISELIRPWPVPARPVLWLPTNPSESLWNPDLDCPQATCYTLSEGRTPEPSAETAQEVLWRSEADHDSTNPRAAHPGWR